MENFNFYVVFSSTKTVIIKLGQQEDSNGSILSPDDSTIYKITWFWERAIAQHELWSSHLDRKRFNDIDMEDDDGNLILGSYDLGKTV